MYAIIKDGSKQYKVEKGGNVLIDRKLKTEGEKIEFANVLVFNDGEKVKVGNPTITGVKVTGVVVKEIKDKKLRAFKYKRRKGYHKTIGHRQRYTLVKITDIITG